MIFPIKRNESPKTKKLRDNVQERAENQYKKYIADARRMEVQERAKAEAEEAERKREEEAQRLARGAREHHQLPMADFLNLVRPHIQPMYAPPYQQPMYAPPYEQPQPMYPQRRALPSESDRLGKRVVEEIQQDEQPIRSQGSSSNRTTLAQLPLKGQMKIFKNDQFAERWDIYDVCGHFYAVQFIRGQGNRDIDTLLRKQEGILPLQGRNPEGWMRDFCVNENEGERIEFTEIQTRSYETQDGSGSGGHRFSKRLPDPIISVFPVSKSIPVIMHEIPIVDDNKQKFFHLFRDRESQIWRLEPTKDNTSENIQIDQENNDAHYFLDGSHPKRMPQKNRVVVCIKKTGNDIEIEQIKGNEEPVEGETRYLLIDLYKTLDKWAKKKVKEAKEETTESSSKSFPNDNGAPLASIKQSLRWISPDEKSIQQVVHSIQNQSYAIVSQVENKNKSSLFLVQKYPYPQVVIVLLGCLFGSFGLLLLC
jgi:hypothetical protein